MGLAVASRGAHIPDLTSSEIPNLLQDGCKWLTSCFAVMLERPPADILQIRENDVSANLEVVFFERVLPQLWNVANVNRCAVVHCFEFDLNLRLRASSYYLGRWVHILDL
jgi:hypothetical protein